MTTVPGMRKVPRIRQERSGHQSGGHVQAGSFWPNDDGRAQALVSRTTRNSKSRRRCVTAASPATDVSPLRPPKQAQAARASLPSKRRRWPVWRHFVRHRIRPHAPPLWWEASGSQRLDSPEAQRSAVASAPPEAPLSVRASARRHSQVLFASSRKIDPQQLSPPTFARRRTSAKQSCVLAPNRAAPPPDRQISPGQTLPLSPAFFAPTIDVGLYLNNLKEIGKLASTHLLLNKMGQMTAEPSTASASGANGGNTPLEEPPLFLRKTFQMIDQCPQNLGGWSAQGDTFLVYDADTFARVWIPRFFRHNKFSSFVRQLNFYGFRKVKSDEHGLRRDIGANGQRMWEFRHDLFKKDHPELMRLINRRRDREAATSANNQEVFQLKNELSTVRNRCEELEKEMKSLKQLFKSLADECRASKQIDHVQMPGESQTQASSSELDFGNGLGLAHTGLAGGERVRETLSMTLRSSSKRAVGPASAPASEQPRSKRQKTEEGSVMPPALDREPLQRFPSWGEVGPLSPPALTSFSSVDVAFIDTMIGPESMLRSSSDIIPDDELLQLGAPDVQRE
eukprot:scaffold908_cov228-Pinguiococcus_pyrenoidosus.AAC.14